MLFFSYYVISFLSLVMFFLFSKAYKIPLLRFSTIAYVVGFIFIILPGYYVAEGSLLDDVYNKGMKIEIYIIYLLYAILVPLCLLIGNIIGSRYSFQIEERKGFDKRLKYIIAGVIVYAIAYFLWLPQIPINYVLMNPTQIFEATMLRLSITHQQGSNENLPFVFRYWRNIIRIVFLILFVLVILIRKSKSQKIVDGKVIALFLFLVYCFTFTLEKAPTIYIVLAIFLINYLGKKTFNKSIILYGVGVLALLIGMYSIFLGKEYESVFEGLANIVSRIARQSTSVYLQYEYVVENGFLWFQGIQLPIIGDLLNIEFINLSKIVYETLFSAYFNQGGTGTTGGMALASLYFSFSWFSVIIFSFYVIILGFLDIFIFNSFSEKNQSSKNVKLINKAFYIGVTSFYAMALVGTIFLIFSSTLFFNPSFYFIFLAYILLVKPGSIVFKKY